MKLLAIKHLKDCHTSISIGENLHAILGGSLYNINTSWCGSAKHWNLTQRISKQFLWFCVSFHLLASHSLNIYKMGEL